ncbi:MAG: T9SS type A sorting domain-containing protein [Bacteroidales bacterium]|nr:T9SS type A sorting domain-containing protein [Bacteroidales bacterium]
MKNNYLIYLILVCLMLVPHKGFSQYPYWDTISMDPSVMFSDLCVLPDGQHGWVVGSTGAAGEILSSIVGTTNGGDWEQIPFPAYASVSLQGVYFVSPDSGWVVGNGGVIYATSDGGQSWQQQSSGTSRKLYRVHFVNSLTGWITGGWQDGSSFLVLKTTDGGNSWQNLSFGSTCYSSLDIYFTDEQNGWICGHDNQLDPHIHHTTDGGTTWTSQSIPIGSGIPHAIEFADENIGWSTTSSLYVTPYGAILHTTDGGTTWEIQTHTGLHYNYCLDVKDAQHVALAAVQILSPLSEKIFITSDGGLSWDYKIPPVKSYTHGIQYVGDDIWFAADYSQLLHSQDNGDTWDWDFKSSMWKSVEWSDADNGWVIAGTYAGNDGYCFRTTDGGDSWFRDVDAPGGAQVQFINPNTGWMLGEGTSPSIWRTTDGGNSWDQSYIGGGEWIGDIFFVNENKGWAYGSNGTLKVTQDGGISWTSQAIGTSNYVAVVFFVDENVGWAAGGYGGGNGFIHYTSDGGNTWTPQTPAQNDHFQAGYFTSDKNGWLTGVTCSVHKTTDGGLTWTVVSQLDHDYMDKLLMEDDDIGWLAARNHFGSSPGEDGRGFIYKTEDGGNTWDLKWTGPYIKSGISDLSFQEPGKIWACGSQNTILEWVTEPIGFREIVIEPSKLQVYPNPFCSEVNFTYTLDKPAKISMNIYDISGHLVASLIKREQNEGSYNISWDCRNEKGGEIGEGIYLCTFQADNKVWTEKIIKVK